MRIWHKDLIAVLPDQQLTGQWRECCCIAKNISANGSPNHLLVNKVMDFPMCHFYTYGRIVYKELTRRGKQVNEERFTHYFTHDRETVEVSGRVLFSRWHTDRYYRQCYYNLQEKYDCGGLTDEEWRKIDSECRPKLFW